MDSVRYFLALIVAITLPPLFLYWLIIHPLVNFWRGKGIGTRLVSAILERARKRGAREVFLEVRRTNLTAQRLYRRMGFREIGVRKSYYVRPVEDALVMRCVL